MEFIGIETDEDVRRGALEQSLGACSISVTLQNGNRIEITGDVSGAAVGEIVRAAAA